MDETGYVVCDRDIGRHGVEAGVAMLLSKRDRWTEGDAMFRD